MQQDRFTLIADSMYNIGTGLSMCCPPCKDTLDNRLRYSRAATIALASS